MKKVIDLGKIGITLAGEYNDKATYEKLTIVLYKGKSYISTKTTQGISPEEDILSWQLVAEAKDAYHMLVDAGKTNLTEEEFLVQLEDATKGRYIVQGNITNAADEEDLTTEHSDLLGIDTLKLANRDNTDGMGYVILRKNKSFAEQVTKENTIYEIRYDFTIEDDITIPYNCVLEFNGGSISGAYTLTGNNTSIKANEKDIIFTGVIFDGSWIVKDIYATWFFDVEQTNRLKQVFNLTSNTIHNNVYLPSGLNCSINAVAGEEELGQINLKSYTDFYFKGTITLQPNALWGYRIIEIKEVKDVTIKGSGTIVGDKDNHTMNTTKGHTSNEWCYGIHIGDSQNVTIEGINIRKCTGDCIDINSTPAYEALINNYVLRNFTCYDSRRQGLSIELCDTVLVENFKIDTVAGTAPESGINIEPGWYHGRNITIRNGVITNTKSISIQLFGNSTYNEVDLSNIVIDNVSCSKGISVTKASYVTIRNINFTGITSIFFNNSENCLVDNCIINSYYSNSWGADTNCKNITFRNCKICNSGTSNNCTIDRCIFCKKGSITCYDTRVANNIIITNSIFINTALTYINSKITNLLFKDNLVYLNSFLEEGQSYFADFKNISDNISFINNKFVLKKMLFGISSAVTGYIEFIDNVFYSNQSFIGKDESQNNSVVFYKNLYNTNTIDNSKTPDVSNLKIIYVGSYDVPQYLLNLI